MSTDRTTPATILGRYRVEGELGRGAMGVVYRAVDPLLERPVAVKTVNLSEAGDAAAEFDARFQQEAKAAARLAHPNVITVYDVGRQGQVAFMAMEFLEGRDLREIMADRPRLPVAEAIGIAAQVADGLAYAHERGVVHRDIKPANIMVLGGGLAKIMDFGIARLRVSDVRTRTGVLLGSPKYMSPEQVLGQGADARSDLFSLGVVLYEMLTGAAPFSGDSVSNLMHQIATASTPAPSRFNSEVPPLLDLVVAKALAKKPEERYQSGAQFAADLRECGAGLAAAQQRKAPDDTIAKDRTLRLAADSEPMRGLCAQFDSSEATRRLAAATGAHRTLENHVKTLLAAPRPAPGTGSRPPRPDARHTASPQSGWNRQERLVVATSVIIATCTAVFIALA
ncbi:MAG: serine/threonine protein kinase [Burkholderiales bacterium]|nr:serine/threonine protein kinase [Burkholderiales bacterium]